MLTFVHNPQGQERLGDLLTQNLNDKKWLGFRAAVAFVKASGVSRISKALTTFAKRADIRISVVIDQSGTSVEGLTGLLNAVGSQGGIWIFHNRNRTQSPTFHPKISLFSNDRETE